MKPTYKHIETLKNENSMKTFSRMVVALLMVFLPTIATAQSGIETAIKNFLDSKSNGKSITVSNFLEEQEADSLPKWYYHEYKFSVNKKNKQFERMREAFEDGQCNYYSKWAKMAGEEAENKRYICYGARAEQSVLLGKHKNRNYIMLCVRDNNNEEWRTCYTLVWYNDAEDDDVYNGILYEIYSPDPRKINRKRLNRSLKIGDKTFDFSDLNDNMAELNEALKDLPITINGFNTGKFHADSISIGDGYLIIDGKKIELTDQSKKIKSADEFLNRFGSLRSLYLDAVKDQRSSIYRTSLINKIVSLCKDQASILSVDEKEVCTFGIKEMQKQTTEEYDRKLFNIALKALK